MLDNPCRSQAHSLTVSQAHKLLGFRRPLQVSGLVVAAGVSKTRRYRPLSIAIFLSIASVSSFSGCGVSAATTAEVKADGVPEALEIDAGVIFSDRANYLCMPLSRMGLSCSHKIKTLTSSCECVKPSVVQYLDSLSTTADGVLIEFVPDETTRGVAPQAVQLGIVLTLTLMSGETREFTVNFLHTSPKVSQH